MRIIHTADWHIGQTLAGYGREHEHRAVLAELVRVVAEREADALIVAGDVFDSQNPSGEAQALFYDALTRLHRARPQMTIVVTAGNHDAAGRLEAPGPLLRGIGVHVVGNVRRHDGAIDARRHLVPLKTDKGEIAAHVLAVSYPTAACLPPLGRYGGDIARATADLYAELMEGARPHLGGLPLVVTGHLHVAGGLESEGAERRILVGGEHALSHRDLPGETEAAYVALGHLHKPQSIGRETIRYSGSLLPLSATEQPYQHGVTLLTLPGGGRAGAGNCGGASPDAKPAIEHIPVARPVPFLRLPAGRGDIRLDTLGDHLKTLGLDPALPIERQPFLHVQLARDGVASGFRAEADRIAEAFPVRLVDVRLTPLATRPGEDAAASQESFTRLAELEPEDLFRRAFERAHGTAPERAHLDVFHLMRAEA